MRRFVLNVSVLLVAALLWTGGAQAGGRRVADYPLRVHVYEVNWHSHYSYGTLAWVDGEGRANLFENSEGRGFDFGYRCGERFRGSMGYETYPARWKKPGRELEILVPVMGKPDGLDSCGLQVSMKDVAYTLHSGMLGEEPIAKFKEWMDRVHYDPEKGLNEPIREPAPAAPAPPRASAAH